LTVKKEKKKAAPPKEQRNMRNAELAVRPKRARSPQSNGRKTAEAAQPTARSPTVSDDQRRSMIAEAAYLRAAQRDFKGDPVADWLDSEREVDALLARSAH
jgi:hypothetical protein